MKQCSKCNKQLPLNKFSRRFKNKSDRLPQCKDCYNERSRIFYKRHRKNQIVKSKRRNIDRKKFVRDYKDNKPCVDCGIHYRYYILDFDHLKDKVLPISEMVTRYSIARIKQEIDKCDLVCSNCHRERTHQRSAR